MELVDDFMVKGWDTSKPNLVGYFLDGDVQLLSGTHRQAAAIIAGIMVPVIVWSETVIKDAWGTDKWFDIMNSGNPTIH